MRARRRRHLLALHRPRQDGPSDGRTVTDDRATRRCRGREIKRVYVYKFDRLGRAADTHIIAQQLEDAGVELISVTEGTNALARGIQLVVAEDYSRQLAMRTRDGLLKRFEQGAFTGGMAPYGYHVVGENGRRVLAI